MCYLQDRELVGKNCIMLLYGNIVELAHVCHQA